MANTEIGETQDAPDIKTGSPFTLSVIDFQLRGPIEVKKNFWDGRKIGRGFRFSLALMDESDKSTASDGEVIFALVPEKPTGTPGAFRGLGTLGVDQAAPQKAISKASYHETVPVSRDDFERKEFTIRSFMQQSSQTITCITFERLTPPLFFLEGWPLGFHVWFKMVDGKLLYNLSQVIWS